MSRELDIKVAEAMGWTNVETINGNHFGKWPAGSSNELDVDPTIPCYSSSYSRLPEMLKHLDPLLVTIRQYGPECWSADVPFGTGSLFGDGKDIPDAVARLVVAVAEARR